MIEKKESTLKTIVQDIEEFYDEEKYHFLTLNGVKLEDETIEVQWIFCKYGQADSTMMFYVVVDKSEVIPSVTDVLPSAIISQRELVDMFGLEVEASEKGLYLDEDSLQAPLGSCELNGVSNG
jgi:Ni,Fe-hydrogenase III component G